MILETYQEQAATTAVYPDQHTYSYPALGACDEVGEFCEKLLPPRASASDLIDELGDVMWYAAQTATDFGLSLYKCYFKTGSPNDAPDFAMLFAACRLAGRVKKIMRGDDIEGKIEEITLEIGKIVRSVEAIAPHLDTTLDEVCERNLDKLFDRQERGVIKGDGDNR